MNIFQSDTAFSESPVICDIEMSVSPFILKQNRSCTKFLRVSFCPERTLSVLIFLYFLQGVQRHISPSGDFEDEQGVRNIDSLHPGQDMELFRMFFCSREQLFA